MNGPNAPYWRVFYTAPRREKKCETALTDRGIEAYLPKRSVVRQWCDRKTKVVEPLFPSYIFAHVDEGNRLRVLRTDGIVRCVAFGGTMAHVQPEEIEQIRILETCPDRTDPWHGPLPMKGESVTITSGPMKGLRGEVVDVRGKRRLFIRVPSVRQALSLDVPIADVTLTAA